MRLRKGRATPDNGVTYPIGIAGKLRQTKQFHSVFAPWEKDGLAQTDRLRLPVLNISGTARLIDTFS